MRIRASSDADAVAGPCRPVFERPPPRWIESSGLFEHPRHVSGARIGYAYTNNVLISTRALAQMDAFFDERMALIGSSDTEFFERFACGGRRVVWCDTAVVREWVSPSRATFGWLMRRALRVGTAGTFIDRQCREQPVCICQIALHGGWCLAKGLALAAFGMLRGRGAAARGLSLGSYGAGRLLGLTGWAYEEYRTTHGA
jgi:hypothetical protein